MKVGEIVLYLHKFGGQAHLTPVTIKGIINGSDDKSPYDYDIVHVEEFDGYVIPSDLWTKETILSLFKKVKKEL